MGDTVIESQGLPTLREENRFAATNYVNEVVVAMGGGKGGDGKTFQGRNRAYIAKVTGPATGVGYYAISIYERAATICNPLTSLTSAKLEGTLIGTGYGYNLDERDASTHVITDTGNAAGKHFRAYFDGQYHSDNKPVLEMIGNPIAVAQCAASRPVAYTAYREIDSDDTTTEDDQILRIISDGITLTLPDAFATGFVNYTVINGTAATSTIAAAGTDTIDGVASISILAGATLTIICTGALWISV